MEIHHGRHHQGYVDKLNTALEGHEDHADMPVERLISDLGSIPSDIREAVRNNGGGHANHSLFWTVIAPTGGGSPSGSLAAAIDKCFGGFEKFQKEFTSAAAGRFGSGWAWLCASEKDGSLFITSTPNQDSPLMKGIVERPGRPILGCDVWEHAYYLKYQNKRADYLEAFWNVVNWDAVADRYTQE